MPIDKKTLGEQVMTTLMQMDYFGNDDWEKAIAPIENKLGLNLSPRESRNLRNFTFHNNLTDGTIERYGSDYRPTKKPSSI